MTIDRNLLNLEADTINANAVKNTVLNQLLIDNLITQSQYEEYTEMWNVVIVKKGWFKKWFDKFNNGSKSEFMYQYVKFDK